MSVKIKTKLNTINTKLDGIDSAVKSGKKKIADALIFNGVTEAQPNTANPTSYMTFKRYAELITSLKTRTSPMKLVFNIDHTKISASAKSTNYKRTIILPVSGISGYSLNTEAWNIISADEGSYAAAAGTKSLKKGGEAVFAAGAELEDGADDHKMTDMYGNECVDGTYIPSMEDIEEYLPEEDREELLFAMGELGITPSKSVKKTAVFGASGESNPDAIYNYTVDWGDGSTNEYVDGDTWANNKAAVIHTYAQEGIYQVQITGNFRTMYSNAESETDWVVDGAIRYDKDGIALGNGRNLAMMYYLTEVRAFGNTLLKNCANAFCRCTKLKTLPSDLSTNAFADVITFADVFYGCTSLASLPYDEVFEVGLFSNCAKCTSFAGAFRGCTGLTGNIPLKLMDGCTSCTTVANLFNGCTNLRGAVINGVESIPSGLIAGMTALTAAGGMFSGCSGLAGVSITGSDLFKDSPNLTSISELFRNLGVVGTLEKNFFPIVTDEQGNEIAGANKITDMRQAFWHSGITAIESNAFAHMKADGINFRDCFNACPIATLPTGLLEDLTGKNLKLERMFEDCTSLTSIPSGALSNMKVSNARGMFGGCSALVTNLPELEGNGSDPEPANANSDWASYQYMKKWYGAFAGTNLSNLADVCLELGGNGARKFRQGAVGGIALNDGTIVDPKDYVYDANNKPVGVVYADMYVSGLSATRANDAGNVVDGGASGTHKIYATVLNDTTKTWVSAQALAKDISTITNTSTTAVSYGTYTWGVDGTTQTLDATRYDGEAYHDALRKWVFQNGYYLTATPVTVDGTTTFNFATAVSGTFTTYSIISTEGDVSSANADATNLYFIRDTSNEFLYHAYKWNGSALVADATLDANLKTMQSSTYPAMSQVNAYSQNGITQGDCFLPDAADLWDQFVMRHLIKKAIDKIVAGGGSYTTDNTNPMRDGTYYWGSAEYSQSGAWLCSTSNAYVHYNLGKWLSIYVRPSLALAAA